MIWKITKKEILTNILTFRFTVGTVLLLVLTVIFTSVLIGDYRQNLEDYNRITAKNNEDLNQVMVYRNLKPVFTKPPEILSLFSKGVDNKIAKSIQISVEEIPNLTSASTAKNPLLAAFSIPDIVLVFKLVISVLAFLMAYDAVSGEKEDGTLRLMLANNLPRSHIITGKFLGGLLTLAMPITLGFILIVLILVLSPLVSLAAGDMIRIVLMFLVSLVMVAVFLSLGLAVSSLTQRPSDSLLILLFLWVMFLLIIPNISSYLALKTKPVEPLGKIRAEIQELNRLFNKERYGIIERLPSEGIAIRSDQTEPWGYFVKFATGAELRETQKINEQVLPLRARLTEAIGEVNQRYLDSLAVQKAWADSLRRTSPISVYEKIMSALSRTDMESLQDFSRQAHQYRRQIMDYLNAKKAFSSLRYFTTIPEDRIFDVNSNEEYKALRDKFGEYQPTPLDVSDMPRLSFRPEPESATVKRIFADILLLGFMAFALFTCAFVAMLKYDVR